MHTGYIRALVHYLVNHYHHLQLTTPVQYLVRYGMPATVTTNLPYFTLPYFGGKFIYNVLEGLPKDMSQRTTWSRVNPPPLSFLINLHRILHLSLCHIFRHVLQRADTSTRTGAASSFPQPRPPVRAVRGTPDECWVVWGYPIWER